MEIVKQLPKCHLVVWLIFMTLSCVKHSNYDVSFLKLISIKRRG